MTPLRPKKIDTCKDPPGIVITWSDGVEQKLSFVTLRKECPCALCKGERTPFDPLAMPVAKPLSPQATRAVDMFKVGDYALGFRWGDGHSTGIYSFEYLRGLS